LAAVDNPDMQPGLGGSYEFVGAMAPAPSCAQNRPGEPIENRLECPKNDAELTLVKSTCLNTPFCILTRFHPRGHAEAVILVRIEKAIPPLALLNPRNDAVATRNKQV
jgi:hypothetical protein